jgi:3-hydroxyisobutyrate dehydrogenase
MARVALLGTGIMGAPMARSLLRAGHQVRVWNRTTDKAKPLADEGAELAATPAEAVRERDIVVTMLADAPAVEQSVVESGSLDAIAGGAVWIQSSTIGVAGTERLATLTAEREIAFVDAPVLGSRIQAEEGQLVVLASGPDNARARSEPVFEAVARSYVWVGEVGAGTRLKLVVNSWIICTVENIGETFALAQALGLDPRSFLDAVSGGATDMEYAHIKGEAIMNENFSPSFPLRLARKDALLILEAAGELELPVVRATLRQLDRALELGHADEDMSAVYYASTPAAGARGS